MQTPRHLGRPDRLDPGTSECHCRRHRRRRCGSAPPGQPAHRPTRPAGRYRHPGRWPWRVAHPHVPGPDHTCPGSGVPAAAVLAETLGKTSRHRSPPSLLRRARSRHTPLRLIDPQRGASPTAAARGSSAPHSCPPSPPCAPTPRTDGATAPRPCAAPGCSTSPPPTCRLE